VTRWRSGGCLLYCNQVQLNYDADSFVPKTRRCGVKCGYHCGQFLGLSLIAGLVDRTGYDSTGSSRQRCPGSSLFTSTCSMVQRPTQQEAKFRLLLRRWDTMYCEENLGHCRHELEGGGPNGNCYLGSEPWASQHHSHDRPHTSILTLVRT
jgi:hypothetical protein